MSQIKFELAIKGMHCAACSSRIERVVSKMAEVEKVSVSLPTNRAQVLLKDGISKTDGVKAVIERIEKLNFGAKLSEGADLVKEWQKENEESAKALSLQFKSLPPMIALAVVLLYISMGHMVGLPLPTLITPEVSPSVFALIQLLLVLPIMYLGLHFYRDGLSNLIQGAPNMDSLVAVGTGAAFLYSIYSTLMIFTGDASFAMNLYFESCGVLIAMISIGQYMEAKSKRKASDAIGSLMRLVPQTARRYEKGSSEVVKLSELMLGDAVLVQPGERIPVDGTVLEGASEVDQSLLTGESIPVAVKEGGSVIAGSLNGTHPLIVKITHLGNDTTLAQIIRLVRSAQSSKAPVAALIMLLMIAMMVFDFIPVAPVTAVMIAGILMVLTGCFRNVEAAYKTINWESIVLIAAMLPMSQALEKTGVSDFVSDSLVQGLGTYGPFALMAGIYFTTSLLTMFISNTATAVLLAPIALHSAVQIEASPVPFLFAVAVGASMCFASPFSTPPNALVMPAGQYTFMDYIKVGLPLQIIMGIVMVFVLPLLFPF